MPSTRTISANGIEIFLREQGTGPLVLLCHGWPELSYSWRHQIPAIAAAGLLHDIGEARIYRILDGLPNKPEDPKLVKQLVQRYHTAAGAEVAMAWKLPTEIVDANWYRRDDLPAIPPGISIARKLIDAWLDSAPSS